MKMIITETKHGTPEALQAEEFLRPSTKARKYSSRYVALQVFKSPDARILLAHTSRGKLIGCASFRDTPDGVQRINTAALIKGRGIGSALVSRITELTNSRPQWCKSAPSANRFCERLGMKRIETRPDGLVLYRSA